MSRAVKDLMFEQVARVGKALSSPKRLELLQILAQGPRSVEDLAGESGIELKLASAHLRALREARLVAAQRVGRFIHYRLAGDDVASLWANLHEVAEVHLVELQAALARIVSDADRLTPQTRANLLKRAARGEIVVLDVRPDTEFQQAHLPHARSIPLPELKRRLAELPRGKEVVAYCRGPFCLMSGEAVELLRARGYSARKITDGVAEWSAAGFPLERVA